MNSDSNMDDTLWILETKLKNAELTMANNRIKIDSLVSENQKLKDLLIEALCKVANIESDL
jgi:hypothetical protein